MAHSRTKLPRVIAALWGAVLLVGVGAWAVGGAFARQAARAPALFAKDEQGIVNVTPAELVGVDVVEHLGTPLPPDEIFLDADGRTVRVGELFDGKRPTMLVFAYHTCPMLCSLVLDGVTKTLRDVPWTVGEQFDVAVISIDPRDTPESAAKKRAQVVEKYGRSAKGWRFLVGQPAAIEKVTGAVGFQYRYDAEKKEYAHPAAIYVLTPKGILARYLYGIEFDSSDVRFGLMEASEGRLTTGEKLLMYCYHYDPKGKKYVPMAMNIMRLGGGATAVALGSVLTALWARERRKRQS